MKNAPNLEIIPEKIGEIPEIELALNIANPANLSLKELEKLRKQEVFIQDQLASVIKGKEEGKKQGKLEEARAIFLRLLSKRFGEIPSEIRQKIQQLSLEKLEELTESIFDLDSIQKLRNLL